MNFITIDGDDTGKIITSCYLRNDLESLKNTNSNVNRITMQIAAYLESDGFTVIFCAADGVAAYRGGQNVDWQSVHDEILKIGGDDLRFSAGVGSSLRDSYMALLYAKSSGKGCLRLFRDLG